MADGSKAALEQHRPDSTGLPSRVIRTQGQPRTLAWWGDLEPEKRAEMLEWLYQNRHNVHRSVVTAEEWD